MSAPSQVTAEGRCGILESKIASRACLESQWPTIMGYFGSFMGYIGV